MLESAEQEAGMYVQIRSNLKRMYARERCPNLLFGSKGGIRFDGENNGGGASRVPKRQ